MPRGECEDGMVKHRKVLRTMSMSARQLNATPCAEAGGKKDGREGFSGCDCEFAIEATDGVSVRACILDSARASCFRAGPFHRPTSNLAAARVHNRLAAPAAQHHAIQIQFSHSPTTLAFIHRKYGKRCSYPALFGDPQSRPGLAD